ncbi:7-cyano-7-deazaguanine synthase [Arthrobacter sp. zg-Y820]|uniref:7-cyano-7-deazaguanine synthase n=1 Tax=unclassified Arthrobacter TaxID=235627 RepID=UPI001E394841|nr:MULTISPECIES: 7-cyano-7-deazaguanine synthase [unclassified Arthrobacter]MCC9198019.1 7-cyano-7-deazaguanine synthase [Arthrobacter sp. zg-Y820]MDK1280886.1 7-cyano-7-deazaguanine synthase [Arthrobacter sp. zg.Y820]WIB10364.1 7-cyano-7-deazaguanine synthase [Arthrobacter sp. zg-Y820]
MEQSPVNTLWTSGWDSTYRIADLVLKQRIPVSPWYVMDENRRSTAVELRTLAGLRELIASKDSEAGELLGPLVVRRRKDIPTDSTITEKYDTLFARGYLGKQYEWLARLASAENVEFELGLKADDRPTKMLMDYIVPVEGPGLYTLGQDVGDEPLRLFERFFFPILDMTKADMMANAREYGFLDVLNETWFCHCPTLSGKACGWCAPCEHAREEGFGWRVPKATAVRRLEFLAQKVIWKGRLAFTR